MKSESVRHTNAVDMAQTVNNFLELYCPDKPKYFAEYAFSACMYLGLFNLKNKEISIELKRQLENDSYGICYGDDEAVEIHIALYQWGRPLSREDKLSTLGHELVHAKQYLLGHLQNSTNKNGDEMGVWKGHTYLWTDNSDELPWEQEAYKLEKEIYEHCTGTRPTLVSGVSKRTRKTPH
jgi:hypothetical protein